MSMADYNKMVYMCRMANLMGVECKNVVFHLFMFCVEGLLYLLKQRNGGIIRFILHMNEYLLTINVF